VICPKKEFIAPVKGVFEDKFAGFSKKYPFRKDYKIDFLSESKCAIVFLLDGRGRLGQDRITL
jgi:hypothetical protein